MYDDYDPFWDDPPYAKMEPDCGRCNDRGCWECCPSWLRVRWWALRGWVRSLFPPRHDDGLPF